MKNIELTDVHKSKLLEMCEKLFPEHNIDVYDKIDKSMNLNSVFIDYSTDICINENTNLEEVITKEFSIHWFEFCHCYLFEKIYVKPNGYESISDYISMNSDFIIGHPVDYLYEEFKKLK